MIPTRVQQIYIMRPIGMPGPIKVGCSCWPKDRLEVVAQWSPFPLEIIAIFPGTFKTERAIHDYLLPSRSHKEWFHASPLVDGFVARILKGHLLEEIFDMSVSGIRARRKMRREANLTYSMRPHHTHWPADIERPSRSEVAA
jgi:hypothetical protein